MFGAKAAFRGLGRSVDVVGSSLIKSRISRTFCAVIDVKYLSSLPSSNIMDDCNLEKCWPLAAVCQVNSKNNKDTNFRNITILLQKAKRTGAIMAFLPECFDYIGESVEESMRLAEPIDGPLIASYCELARKMQMWLSLGGFHERVPEQNKCYNSHIVIDASGKVASVYRKIHLYDVDIPNRITLKESAFSRPGPCLGTPVPTPIGNMGMLICYDLRFAEESLLLRQNGAEILTYPSAFTVETGMSHWETLLRARAIENQTYVIAAAQSGRHNARRVSFGHSMIVDPWGTIVAQCTDEMDVAVAEINLDRVEWIRSRMPVAQHRRYDLYSLSARTPQRHATKQIQNDADEIVDRALHAESMQLLNGEQRKNGDSEAPHVNGPAEISSGNMTHNVSDADDEGRGGSDADSIVTQPNGDHASNSKFIFGKISLKPEHVFYTTNLSFAFVNLKPVLPGHVLVAPRRHVERLHQLSAEEMSDLFRVVQLVERAVNEHFHGTSSTVTVQDGPDAGQSIAHVHVHVMPRREGDFEHNDDVYTEIAREAQAGPSSSRKDDVNKNRKSDDQNAGSGVDADSRREPRSDEEMTAEAAILRKVIAKMNAGAANIRETQNVMRAAEPVRAAVGAVKL